MTSSSLFAALTALCLLVGDAGADADPGDTTPLTVRGLYVTAALAGSGRALSLADSLREAGGNGIVYDVKDREGDISHVSGTAMARQTQVCSLATIEDPRHLVQQLQARGMHVVARVCCFYDERLSATRPDLAPRLADGQPWASGWLDPANVEVQGYLLELIAEVAAHGVDEIQLDYVRFPTEQGVEAVTFAIPDTLAKHRVITDFVRRVRQSLVGGTLLSADLFGVAAWGRPADLERIGQHLPDLIGLLDVACPMLYPSHFYGSFAGVDHPVDYPYYLVHAGLRRLLPLAREHAVSVRPWLQAFPYRITDFDVDYVSEQIQAAADAGADGWFLWHPASRFEIGLQAVRQVTEGRARPTMERQPPLPGALSGTSSSRPAATDPSSPAMPP